MSVAFSASRKVVLGQEDSAESGNGVGQLEVGDRHSARCAWSFCSGQDRELPSSADEEGNLLNLRDVTVKYGSQPIDSESDTEEGTRSCENPERAKKMAGHVGLIAFGLLTAAALVPVSSNGCWEPSNDSFAHNDCPLRLGSMLPLAALFLTLSVLSVKNLVQTYREANHP